MENGTAPLRQRLPSWFARLSVCLCRHRNSRFFLRYSPGWLHLECLLHPCWSWLGSFCCCCFGISYHTTAPNPSSMSGIDRRWKAICLLPACCLCIEYALRQASFLLDIAGWDFGSWDRICLFVVQRVGCSWHLHYAGRYAHCPVAGMCLFPSFHDEDDCCPIFLYMPGIAGGYQQMHNSVPSDSCESIQGLSVRSCHDTLLVSLEGDIYSLCNLNTTINVRQCYNNR